jgi:hypothetical protein
MNDSLYLLAESHHSNEVLRTLIKLIPYGSIVDNNLSSFYTKEKERRLKVFFDELDKGAIPLTKELLDSDEFLHKYFITLKAVLETNALRNFSICPVT